MAEVSRLDRLSDAAAEELLATLRETRARLDRELARRALTDYGRSVILARRAAVERELDRMAVEMARRMGDVVREGAAASARDVAEVGGVQVAVDPGVVAFAAESAADEVRNVADDVRRGVRRAVVRALAGGLNREGLDLEIERALGSENTRGRVERIARTEVGRAYGQQGVAANRELIARGSDLIQRWIATPGERTRESHQLVDGQERELDQPFHVGLGATAATPPDAGIGYACNAPLDPALPPEESIQCRCRRVLVPREEAQQPYIRRADAPQDGEVVRIPKAAQPATEAKADAGPAGAPSDRELVRVAEAIKVERERVLRLRMIGGSAQRR